MSFEIVGRMFTPAEFQDYVKSLDLKNAQWHGKFVVLHNTGVPSLEQRPSGFSAQNMLDLEDFYANTRHWHAGPHLFIDDFGIWAFTPLTQEGVHSPSWNYCAYGVEMLGDYDKDEFGGSVRGQSVRANAVAAVAVLSHALVIDSATMRLHREDPETTHKDCPGVNVRKSEFVNMVHMYIKNHLINK